MTNVMQWHGNTVHTTGPFWEETTGGVASTVASTDGVYAASSNKLMNELLSRQRFKTLWCECNVTVVNVALQIYPMPSEPQYSVAPNRCLIL